MDFFAFISSLVTANGLIPWWGIFVIIGGSFLAGFVDSIAGGGGLISFPSLIVTGIPLHFVIGTTKISSTMGTLVATIKYARNGYMVAWLCIPCIIVALAGADLGAHLSLSASEDFLRVFMLIVLPFAGFYVLKRKNLGAENADWPRKKTLIRCIAISLIVGVYDGFYGPAGVTKCVNLTTNITALVVFALSDTCLVSLGIIGGVFNMAGNYLGSMQFTEKGNAIVRPIMIVVLVLFAIRLISELVA